jgi:hypothetical protein
MENLFIVNFMDIALDVVTLWSLDKPRQSPTEVDFELSVCIVLDSLAQWFPKSAPRTASGPQD